MDKPMRYVLWGSSGLAKVLANVISLRGGQVVALFDNNPNANSVIAGVPLYKGKEGFLNWYENERDVRDIAGLVAIGGAYGNDRLAMQEYFRSHGISIDSIVHPDASVCNNVSIGAGTQILAQSVVSTDVKIGEACIINIRAAVDHECILGEGVHIAPGATLCGCVNVGRNVMIGAGAVVLPRVKIGANTVVGSGAVVTKDLPEGVVVVGSPAKIIRSI